MRVQRSVINYTNVDMALLEKRSNRIVATTIVILFKNWKNGASVMHAENKGTGIEKEKCAQLTRHKRARSWKFADYWRKNNFFEQNKEENWLGWELSIKRLLV